MGTLGKAERIVYWAKEMTMGLTDVKAYIVRPDLAFSGPYPMSEFFAGPFKGVYYFDLLTNTSDPEGEWTVMIWSPTENLRSPYKVKMERPSLLVKETSVATTDIVGVVEDANPVLFGVVGNELILASIDDAFGNISGTIQSEDLVSSTVDSDIELVGAIQDADSLNGALFDC